MWLSATCICTPIDMYDMYLWHNIIYVENDTINTVNIIDANLYYRYKLTKMFIFQTLSKKNYEIFKFEKKYDKT